MQNYIENTLFTNTPGAWFCWTIIIFLIVCVVWLLKIAKSHTISAKKIKEKLASSFPEHSITLIQQIDSNSTTWKNYKNSLIEASVNGKAAYQRSCPSSTFINPETLNPRLFKGYFLTWIPSVLTTLGVLGTFVGLSIGLQGLKLDTSTSTLAIEEKIENTEQIDKDSNAEIAAMLEGIKELIKGAKTAFNTSIFGVTAGILFGVSLRYVRQSKANQIQELTDRLDELILEVSSEKDLRDLKLSNDDASQHLKVLINLRCI
jgi:hypothetical protein